MNKNFLETFFHKFFKKVLDLDVELVYTVLVPTRQRDEQKKSNGTKKKNKKSSKKFKKVLDRSSELMYNGCVTREADTAHHQR